MADDEPLSTAWSTEGTQPDSPYADSTFPTLTMDHVLAYNLLPTDLPARLENHIVPFESVLAITGATTYSTERSSYQCHGTVTNKSFLGQNREHRTAGATAFAIRSARYRSIHRTLKSPSTAKKALSAWKKQGNPGLPPQHMTFSEPTNRQVDGKPHLCITCTLEEAYPNFHIQCILQYLDHTESIPPFDAQVARLAFATLETNESCWVVAFEQLGRTDASTRRLIGEEQYKRLGNVKIGDPDKGVPRDEPANHHVAKKITVPSGYSLLGMWCQTEGFYRVHVYIPEGPETGGF